MYKLTQKNSSFAFTLISYYNHFIRCTNHIGHRYPIRELLTEFNHIYTCDMIMYNEDSIEPIISCTLVV